MGIVIHYDSTDEQRALLTEYHPCAAHVMDAYLGLMDCRRAEQLMWKLALEPGGVGWPGLGSCNPQWCWERSWGELCWMGTDALWAV